MEGTSAVYLLNRIYDLLTAVLVTTGLVTPLYVVEVETTVVFVVKTVLKTKVLVVVVTETVDVENFEVFVSVSVAVALSRPRFSSTGASARRARRSARRCSMSRGSLWTASWRR